MITFTQTDPVTLTYRGGDRLMAAATVADPVNETLTKCNRC